jgi:transcription-repair coupling factor (superfamily II helicase)
LDDLKIIKQDFIDKYQKIDKPLENLFTILEVKLQASKYKITSIKKIGINYQINFEKNIKLEELKQFLELDKEVKFVIVNINKLRTSTKNFDNEEKFLEYMHSLFNKKI